MRERKTKFPINCPFCKGRSIVVQQGLNVTDKGAQNVYRCACKTCMATGPLLLDEKAACEVFHLPADEISKKSLKIEILEAKVKEQDELLRANASDNSKA